METSKLDNRSFSCCHSSCQVLQSLSSKSSVICYLSGVYGDRDITMGHSKFRTIFKNIFGKCKGWANFLNNNFLTSE